MGIEDSTQRKIISFSDILEEAINSDVLNGGMGTWETRIQLVRGGRSLSITGESVIHNPVNNELNRVTL